MDAKVSVVRVNEPTGASGTHNRQFTLPWRDGTELIILGLSQTFRDSWQLCNIYIRRAIYNTQLRLGQGLARARARAGISDV